MNPIEIEEQLSQLADQAFEPAEFPFQFLECYGRKAGEIKALKKGKSNKSDVDGVLQRNNVHILVAEKGGMDDALTTLRNSKATTKNKAHFILTTDGESVAAENLKTGDHLACDFDKLGEEFTFFLPLAGIYFTAEIKNQEIDVKATARLNKLYMELLRENPDWSTLERRHDLNQFMARLIFCFFAEDTDIFLGSDLFTTTLKQLSDSRSGNVSEIIAALFDAMDTPIEERAAKEIRPWANVFPYVNGGLFGGNQDVPKFSRIARSYLIAAGELNWSKINPDIFGSMIQAVADDDERGSLGMHYTSVPNILKVLNPLFLDNLRDQLEAAGSNSRKLLNLRKRIANIRVFDPACGSGNFLVIAYKELRKIEAEILDRREDKNRNTVISLENFYGIELKDFAAQIAQIALLIAEFQCDVLYINQVQACKNMLPLDKANNIVIGNALRLDWLNICPPTAPVDIVKDTDNDLFATPLDQPEINLDEDNLGGETYVCGNPPFAGQKNKTKSQRNDMKLVFDGNVKGFGALDYVAAFYYKTAQYCSETKASSALVSTNSIVQGRQIPVLWPNIFDLGCEITFAHRSFKWSNNAQKNASVLCVIIGLSSGWKCRKRIFDNDVERIVDNITAYLTGGKTIFVKPRKNHPLSEQLQAMRSGNMPLDEGNLILSHSEAIDLKNNFPNSVKFVKPLLGAREINRGLIRYCLWIEDDDLAEALTIEPIKNRINQNEKFRKTCSAPELAKTPHKFRDCHREEKFSIVLPNLSSESREYRVPILVPKDYIISNLALAIYDGDLFQVALLSSRMHHLWVEAVCGKFKSDFRYSNDAGWHTFPLPHLSVEDKSILRNRAEELILTRAGLGIKNLNSVYNTGIDNIEMPEALRTVHERNDEIVERIYIGRRFKTDTERLETLFDLYNQMTAEPQKKARRA